LVSFVALGISQLALAESQMLLQSTRYQCVNSRMG